MSNNYLITNEIIGSYATFLLSGFTIRVDKKENASIIVSTIKGYLRVVNQHYRVNGFREPYAPKDESDADRLLREQEKFEKEPARRSPLNTKMIAFMRQQAKEDPLSFKAAVSEFTAIGCFAGFRQQEFAMDSKDRIKYYVKPDGTCIVRAFTVKNFKFYDVDGIIMQSVLQRRAEAKDLGTEYDVQKNRMNGQIITYNRILEYPEACPVENGLNIVARAQVLGNTEPDDPLCVYRDKNGDVKYLTGTDVTAYFREVMHTVMPNISDEELKLISTHSIRVYACVLLSEAGKDGTYIKLRLRWLSECFNIYLRNTKTITAQHTDALSGMHKQMAALALATIDPDNTVFANGQIDIVMDDLEDDD